MFALLSEHTACRILPHEDGPAGANTLCLRGGTKAELSRVAAAVAARVWADPAAASGMPRPRDGMLWSVLEPLAPLLSGIRAKVDRMELTSSDGGDTWELADVPRPSTRYSA